MELSVVSNRATRGSEIPPLITDIRDMAMHPDCAICESGNRRRRLIYCLCSDSLSKNLLLTMNSVFIIISFVVIGIAMWSVFDKRSFVEYAGWVEDEDVIAGLSYIADSTPLGWGPVIVFIFGVIMFLLSFLGMAAAGGERRLLLSCYATILLVILVLEIGLGCSAIAYRPELRQAILKSMKGTLPEYVSVQGRRDVNGLTAMWNRVMINLECCGVESGNDFALKEKFTEPEIVRIPLSCCIYADKKQKKIKYADCSEKLDDKNSNKNKGCYNAIVYEVNKNAKTPFAIFMVLVLSQITAMVLAFCLCQSLTAIQVRRMYGLRERRVNPIAWN
jgi:hypothetical protein